MLVSCHNPKGGVSDWWLSRELSSYLLLTMGNAEILGMEWGKDYYIVAIPVAEAADHGQRKTLLQSTVWLLRSAWSRRR